MRNDIFSNPDCTENIYDLICFSEPPEQNDSEKIARSIADAIDIANELENRSAFLEGLAERLTALGVQCTPKDTDVMIAEVKRRYKELLGKPCPRTVLEWIRGTTPGTTNRKNNYDLCMALGMDFRQTADFFKNNFLTLPWNCKSRTDAVYLYCIFHGKPYTTVNEMLENTNGYVTQENAHTATSQIFSAILEIDDDKKFMRYLSQHCYGNEQQFQTARAIIDREIILVKERIMKFDLGSPYSTDRLNSMVVESLLGYKYQQERGKIAHDLPKRFTGSLPNDVTLGKIINGGTASYELLRKTMMLLKFCNFYSEAAAIDRNEICNNLFDFQEELNSALNACGFAQIYMLHPFDCLLFYCANNYEPIVTLHSLIERN